MNYLVVAHSGTGIENAIIFETLSDAREHLKEIDLALKNTIKKEWENNDCLIAKVTDGDWIRVSILKVERAEYRLTRHIAREKDEERRFFKRENAIKYVSGVIKTSIEENELGDWTNDAERRESYKLYAVVLDPEKNSNKVLKRFNAANSLSIIGGDIERHEKEEDNEHTVEEVIVKEKNKDSIYKRVLRRIRTISSKKRFVPLAIITATIVATVGLICLNTDWQYVSDVMKANQFSASEEIKSIAKSLDFTRRGEVIFFASQPVLLGSKDFNEICGRDGDESFTSGCYYRDLKNDEHIKIHNVGTSIINENGLYYNFAEYRKSIVLHETLHAIWDRQNEGKRKTICSDLKDLLNQINSLKNEIKIYQDDSLCTELFARVGSEYISILSPNNKVPSSSNLSISYSSLDAKGKIAVSNLVKVYDEYFNTKNYSWVIEYWKSKNQLEAFETKVYNYAKDLDNKRQIAESLINQYYSWPTWGRANAANNAINEYNSMLATARSYVKTYNKVYSKLDSEHTMLIGGELSL